MNITDVVSDARSIITVISMLTFIGIVFWAYSARRKNDFDEAAMLPFNEEDDLNKTKQEPRHG
jgi:cytochrome c oxidase cbb3-type subunit IV